MSIGYFGEAKNNNKKHLHNLVGVLVTSNFLISQAVSSQVPSAFMGLTTVFGMGTGGAPQLSSLDMSGEHPYRVHSLKTSQKKSIAHISY